MDLPEDVVSFLKRHGIATVATLDPEGAIHCAVKGIVGFEGNNKILIMDLYHGRTHRNLKNNPTITITVVNEKDFRGYALQGKARIVKREDIQPYIVDAWEERIIHRITERVLRSVRRGEKTGVHHEAHLPHQPKYLIEVDVDHIVDLTARKSPS